MTTEATNKALSDFRRELAQSKSSADNMASELSTRDSGMVGEINDFVVAVVHELNKQGYTSHRVSYKLLLDLLDKRTSIKFIYEGTPNHPLSDTSFPALTIMITPEKVHVNSAVAVNRQLSDIFSAISGVFFKHFKASGFREHFPDAVS